MADIKITALPALAVQPDALDVIAIVDVSDNGVTASGTTKHITIADLAFLSNGANISLLNNNAGYITSSDFSNGGELATANRDLGNTDAFGLSFITSGVGRINILSGGNVGIGTSTPSLQLEVVGAMKTSSYIISGSDVYAGGTTARMGVYSGQAAFGYTSFATTANAAIRQVSDGRTFISGTSFVGTQILFRTNAVNRLAILDSGEVGIGTLTPSEALEVVGSIKMVDGNQALNKVLTSDANGVAIWQDSDGNGMFDVANNGTGWGVTAFNIPATVVATHASVSHIEWKTQNNGTSHVFNTAAVNKNNNLVWQDFGVNVGQMVYDNVSSGVRGDGFKFYAKTTFATDGETLALLNNDNVIIPNGNLGINTSTPTEKLEVVGNAYVNNHLRVGSSVHYVVAIGDALDLNTSLYIKSGRPNIFNFVDNAGAVSRLKLSTSGVLTGLNLSGTTRLEIGGTPTAYATNQTMISLKGVNGTYQIATESTAATGNVIGFVSHNSGQFSIGTLNKTEKFNVLGITAYASVTAPTISNNDIFKMWSQDIVAGNAAPHFRTENNDIIKLYKQAALTVSDGTLPTAVTRQGEIETILTNLGLI